MKSTDNANDALSKLRRNCMVPRPQRDIRGGPDPDRWRSNRHGLPPGMSPAERIAARVRHRVKESERRALIQSVAAVSSLAEEIEVLKAKAAESFTSQADAPRRTPPQS